MTKPERTVLARQMTHDGARLADLRLAVEEARHLSKVERRLHFGPLIARNARILELDAVVDEQQTRHLRETCPCSPCISQVTHRHANAPRMSK